MPHLKLKKIVLMTFFFFTMILLVGFYSSSQEEKITRRPRPPRTARITLVKMRSMLLSEFEILGKNFGSTQDSNMVYIAGKRFGPDDILEWSDTSISLEATCPPLCGIKPGEYHDVWLENASNYRISNSYRYLHWIEVADIIPNSAPPKKNVMLISSEYSSFGRQGTKKVMFDTVEATVLGWNLDKIKVQVPLIYIPLRSRSIKIQVFIENNGECVSDKRTFTITKH
jgi:hypothetical protein